MTRVGRSCQTNDNQGFAFNYYIGNKCVQEDGNFYTFSGSPLDKAKVPFTASRQQMLAVTAGMPRTHLSSFEGVPRTHLSSIEIEGKGGSTFKGLCASPQPHPLPLAPSLGRGCGEAHEIKSRPPPGMLAAAHWLASAGAGSIARVHTR